MTQPSPVSYALQDNLAVITMNHPPVNSMGQAMRAALLAAFEQALADDSAQGILLQSATALFCGGADISEFGTSKAFAEPSLPMVCNAIEASTKPVFAAIHGMALGGGCELALACDYRIAPPSAKLGLPEVHLGLLPGAGGTQRLPRLIDPALALEMIVSGKPRSAKELAEAGLIDHIVEEDDFLAAAREYAQTQVQQGAPCKSCATIAPPAVPGEVFQEFRASIARKARGFFAPERCIEAVEAACSIPLA
ncbi:MAG: enoyl-CoA hydratase/isomerase family protein, partial [Oleiphilaceae bacterium]|nr:enoyl-CoA hydratase/isomerase family protein [Oleiphilaceae bacterium]